MRTPIMYALGNSAIEEAVRASLYEAVLDILGTGGIVVPLGDGKHGALSGSTVKSVGDEQVTFTASEAWNSFDVGPGKKSLIPIIEFNGTDEECDTTDDAAWDGGNGSTDNPLSMGAWLYPDNFAVAVSIIDKFTPSSQGDYRLQIDATTGVIEFTVNDASASKNPHLDADSGLTAGQWTHVVVTYDGTGGSNALIDPNAVIYFNGVKVAATYNDDGGGYVAMEGGTNDLDIANANATKFFDGRLAGGPMGPFFVKSELSADAVLRLYEVGRRALNL